MKKLLFASIQVAVLVSGVTYAEVIYFKNGDRITGKIVKTDENEVVIRNNEQTTKYKKSDIARIDFSNAPTPVQAVVTPTTDQDLAAMKKHKLEEWYWVINLGYPFIFYHSDPLAASVKLLKNQDASSTARVSIELIDIYFAARKDLVVGGVLAAAYADRVTLDGKFTQMNFYSYSVSALYYFQKHFIGEGFFARLDLGIGHSIRQTDESGLAGYRSPLGFAATTGVGYALPVLSGTRLQIGTNYTLHIMGGIAVSAIQIYAGVML